MGGVNKKIGKKRETRERGEVRVWQGKKRDGLKRRRVRVNTEKRKRRHKEGKNRKGRPQNACVAFHSNFDQYSG